VTSLAPIASPVIGRIELEARKGLPGQYKCLVCDRILEVFDGSREIAYRLTVQPSHLRPEKA
jgi:hypothetical protein